MSESTVWTTAPGGGCLATEDGEHLLGQRLSGALAGPCAACDRQGQVQVYVHEEWSPPARVYLRLGNYEFEIVVPPTIAGAAGAEATADLLQRQLNEFAT